MTPEIVLLLALLGGAVVLFATEWIAPVVRTGVLERLERALARRAERSPRGVAPLLVATTAALSGVLSNTATIAGSRSPSSPRRTSGSSPSCSTSSW